MKLTDRVANPNLKLEWLNREYFEYVTSIPGMGKAGTFCAAGKEYNTSAGKVTVMFNTYMVYLFADEKTINSADDIWTLEDLRQQFKSKELRLDEYFPSTYMNDNVTVLIENGNIVNEEIIEELGLTEHLDDIKARLADLAQGIKQVYIGDDGNLEEE